MGLSLALAFLSRRIGPEHWEGHRDQLSAPIDDEARIVHAEDARETRANL